MSKSKSTGLAAGSTSLHHASNLALPTGLAVADINTKPVARYTLRRDKDRPLAFNGQLLGEACLESALSINGSKICAAVYKTVGGKYVSALTKRATGLATIMDGMDDPESPASSNSNFDKVFIANTFEEAMAWFRPGRVTDALREKLGLNQPEWLD